MHTDLYDDIEDEEDGQDLDPDNDGWSDCAFPGQCLMPGEHFQSECHTAEMLEDGYDRCPCCGQIRGYR